VSETAFLVGLRFPQSGDSGARGSLDELQRLAESAGARVAGRVLQSRDAPDPATYLGSGKAAFVRSEMGRLGCGLALVDDELKPTQQRNLEQALGAKVLDRTQLILDIFAQRARTREGKLQVELAQLSYLLPRLVGWGSVLSRLGGGIGTRGPGETKLETDRRRLRFRIGQLRQEIEEVANTRALQRGTRSDRKAPVAALVGYTNAGKSSLFNALTGSGVFVQDRLFATLDPTIRPLLGGKALLADTVGFIRKLPHDLVAAFRATLEEVNEAGLRLLVADASDQAWEDQRRTVEEVLSEISTPRTARTPTWLVLNKVDALSLSRRRALRKAYPDAFFVSALHGQGLEDLKLALEDAFAGPQRRVVLNVPLAQAGLLSRHHGRLKILSQAWTEQGAEVEALVPKDFHEMDPFLAPQRRSPVRRKA
jgi:GTP-binding protein HflX